MSTLKDIAARSGVSVSVVSRTLNARPDRNARIAADTRRRILQAAQDLGYQRNRAAEFLKRGKHPAIGIFLPEVANRLVADLIFGLAQEADLQGFAMTFSFGMTFEQYRLFIEKSHRQPHCGIISYPFLPLDPRIAGLVDDFRRKGHHLVLINAAAGKGVSSVTLDDEHGGRLAAQRLASLGCRRLICYGRYPSRAKGFREQAQASGIDTKVFDKEVRGIAAIKAARTGFTADAPLGVFAVTDRDALAVMAAFQHEPLTVGHAVRLVGYDDLDMAAFVTPALTTVHQPFKELGKQAIRRIVAVMDGQPHESESIKPWLVIRGSG